MLMGLLHLPSVLNLVDLLVLVVLELGVVAGNGAGQVHLLELVVRFW